MTVPSIKRKLDDFSSQTNINEVKKTKLNHCIRYKFTNNYVDVKDELSPEEQETLAQLLVSFPRASKDNWPNNFSQMDFSNYTKELLCIAANAYDSHGNTMLGVACNHGADVKAVQKLIDMGALLNTVAHYQNKLALHWAINNYLSCADKESFDAVQVLECLLINGADINIKCYQNLTPLKYAEAREFTAAANLIKNFTTEKKLAFKKGAGAGLFNLPDEIGFNIGSFFDDKTGQAVAHTNSASFNKSKAEVSKFFQTQKMRFFTKVKIEENSESNCLPEEQFFVTKDL